MLFQMFPRYVFDLPSDHFTSQRKDTIRNAELRQESYLVSMFSFGNPSEFYYRMRQFVNWHGLELLLIVC